MTLHEALQEFFESKEYKDIAKLNEPPGSTYRTWLNRFKAGKLKSGAIVEILEANGYEIKANKVTKKK